MGNLESKILNDSKKGAEELSPEEERRLVKNNGETNASLYYKKYAPRKDKNIEKV